MKAFDFLNISRFLITHTVISEGIRNFAPCAANSYNTPPASIQASVWWMCVTNVKEHPRERRTGFSLRLKGKLYGCLTCHTCGDCRCCRIDFAVRIGQDLMMLCSSTLGVLRWELCHGKWLDLLRLYQGLPWGRRWLVSTFESSLVQSACEAFKSYHSEIH